MVLVLDGFLDAGNAAAIACRHLVDAGLGDGGGSVVATFDVDQLHDYRARRPPMSFVRDHYEAYDAPRLVVRLLHDTGGTPYLLLHGPEPDNRWEAFAARRARGRRAVRRHPGRRDGLGADGGAAHPADRDHPPRQPTRAAHRREPVARRAADPEQRPGAARGAAGGVGPRRARLRRAHPALPRPARLPAGLGGAARAGRAGRPADRSTSPTCAPRPRSGRRRSPATSPPTRRSDEVVRALEQQYDAFAARRGVRLAACSPTTSRCRPARRSASSSSSSWPGSRAPTSSRGPSR